MTGRVIVRREMGCTRAEFMRWLPGAIRGAAWRIEHGGDDARIAIDLAPGDIALRIDALAPRRVGALALPRLAIVLEFSGVDARRREAFLDYFDLYTRRGGG